MMGRLSRLALSAAAGLAALGGTLLAPSAAHAAVTADRGAAVLSYAHTRAGAPYAYGGSGPGSFDCSGLVAWSARQAGITLPHNTVAMLGAAAT